MGISCCARLILCLNQIGELQLFSIVLTIEGSVFYCKPMLWKQSVGMKLNQFRDVTIEFENPARPLKKMDMCV